ncbi:DNA alkylation repair protein [Secundilactobacillus similis]|uniref:DNA alkylation repair enzyme n=1 Tax=Secundilactobacillus similis DSM 23365 = JCM 2765 TaxID=1423804 RepID=A0A0R2ESB1_9LACO|nr:DNA alkylation repair protein [Secundilactobacillus similis]KRN15612.1 DNA alkylation repair enzyme [Secundilactobacillus similis DSM 23365 = JCM 2765]
MSQFQFQGNSANIEPMGAYMRNQFPFLGVKSPDRKLQSRPLLKQSTHQSTQLVLEWVAEFYGRREREYQYLAIDLAVHVAKRLSLQELHSLTPYVSQKAWWDSVDAWRKVFDVYLKAHPEDKLTVFEWFYGHPDFWQRRISITLQLLEKETLDTELLTRAIEADQTTDEFFIQKAIGWALRSYGKFAPDWVRRFLATHELSALAAREAGKYL